MDPLVTLLHEGVTSMRRNGSPGRGVWHEVRLYDGRPRAGAYRRTGATWSDFLLVGAIFAYADSDLLDERIELRGIFTETVPRDWKLPQLEICLLSSNGAGFNYVCLLTRGEIVATYRRRVRFTDFVELGEPLSFDALAAELPPRLRQHLPKRQPSIVSPRTWDALLGAVKNQRPHAAGEIAQLEELVRNPSPVFRQRGAAVLALERDALAVALMAAEIDRRELRTWRDPETAAPFLSGITQKAPIEDRLIDYDASIFGNWEIIERDASGRAVFEEGPNRLTVINVNRTDVERALGVDLLYYNHRFRSFVLVQYKRMRKESRTDVYRPDAGLAAELARMRLLPVSHDPSTEPSDYRLHPGSCYLKLCPDVPFRPRGDDLIRGMYLPLDGMTSRARARCQARRAGFPSRSTVRNDTSTLRRSQHFFATDGSDRGPNLQVSWKESSGSCSNRVTPSRWPSTSSEHKSNGNHDADLHSAPRPSGIPSLPAGRPRPLKMKQLLAGVAGELG
jgi:hypothetical protein